MKVVLNNPGHVATEMTKGRMDHIKASTTEGVAQAAMLVVALALQIVPMEMTLNTI